MREEDGHAEDMEAQQTSEVAPSIPGSDGVEGDLVGPEQGTQAAGKPPRDVVRPYREARQIDASAFEHVRAPTFLPPTRSISQGEICRDITMVERTVETDGKLCVVQITFPLVLVLTQECDLAQDFKLRAAGVNRGHDKLLLSVLVAPVYNAELVYGGTHLEDLGQKMEPISRTKAPGGDYLRQNRQPRYHYLEFPEDTGIVPSIIDFKHYFSVHVDDLGDSKKCVYKVPPLFREHISQRFANFLARIGLPAATHA